MLLALTGLCHLIPFLFACAGAAVWFLVSLARRSGFVRRLWWSFCALGIGGALMAWWVLPFYVQSGYMNDMGWEKKTDYFSQLFERSKLDPGLVNSPPISWLLVLALLGVVMSIAWKRRGGAFLVGIAAVSALGFIYLPQGRFWNARILPFWFLALYLLAAVGVGELGRTLASLLSRDPSSPRRSITTATALVGTFLALVAIALPLRALPDSVGVGPVNVSLGGMRADGKYHWLMFSTKDSSFIPSWAKWNFTGYEGKPAYPEYHDIVQTMAALGEKDGCGRAMWEHEPQHDRYGTPMALMLLPFWTDGCIGSMEGLYFEASSTTPYHFINQDELSFSPSNAQRDLPYGPGPPDQAQFDLGVQHLQMLGVKYYMAITDQMKVFAANNRALTEVAKSGPWKVYEVADSALVTGLLDQPVVLTDVRPAKWLQAVEGWYMDPTQWSVYPADGGPADWQRITAGELGTSAVDTIATTPVAVTDIRAGTDTISFTVSRPGTPVLVKASYFPNWQADGAKGPWRVGPNLMVVVPTSTSVTLHYGHSPIEWVSLLITIGGLVALVLVARAGAVVMPEPLPWFRRRTDDEDAEAADEAVDGEGDGEVTGDSEADADSIDGSER